MKIAQISKLGFNFWRGFNPNQFPTSGPDPYSFPSSSSDRRTHSKKNQKKKTGSVAGEKRVEPNRVCHFAARLRCRGILVRKKFKRCTHRISRCKNGFPNFRWNHRPFAGGVQWFPLPSLQANSFVSYAHLYLSSPTQ